MTISGCSASAILASAVADAQQDEALDFDREGGVEPSPLPLTAYADSFMAFRSFRRNLMDAA